MQITIISDCQDDNARTRQQSRYQALLGNSVQSLFIGANTDLQAQGELIDAIDSRKGQPAIIIVNIAPRGNKKKYPNGIPFCFHQFGKITIIGTPNCFSLAKKLKMFSTTFQTDVSEVCSKFLSKREAKRVSESQFRSYEYLPYLAKWISEGKNIPSIEIEIADFGKENFIWGVDCFGNCKTTSIGKWVNLDKYTLLDMDFFERLADVPKNRIPAFVRGSSGYRSKRFLEVMIQEKSASQCLGLKVGTVV